MNKIYKQKLIKKFKGNLVEWLRWKTRNILGNIIDDLNPVVVV